MATEESTRPAQTSDVMDASHPVRRRIEAERRRLQKASAVLACLVFSIDHDAPDVDGADVASVARDLINAAVDALDTVALSRGR